MSSSMSNRASELIQNHIQASNLKFKSSDYKDISKLIDMITQTPEICETFRTEELLKESVVVIEEYGYRSHIWKDLEYLLTWFRSYERELLYKSLTILITLKDTGFRSYLGLLGIAKRRCDARKRHVYSQIICLTGSLLSKPTITTLSSNSNELTIDQAIQRVYDFCLEIIDDMKEKAVYSVFLEPCLMYFTYMNKNTAAGDVDIHGSNTFLALLDATVGVKTPRIPLLSDDVNGVCHIHNAGMNDALNIIQSTENFGKRFDYHTKPFPGPTKQVPNKKFIFHGRKVRSLVKCAISKRWSTSTQRLEYAVYLNKFAKYFTAEFLLPRLFNAVCQNDAILYCLRIVFKHLKKLSSNQTSDKDQTQITDCEDVYDYVYDMTDVLKPIFRIESALRLFAYCNIVKSESVEMVV